MSVLRKMVASFANRREAKYMSVEEKEELFKLGYSMKQLHLTDAELERFEQDGLIVKTLAFKPKKRKARHDHCISNID